MRIIGIDYGRKRTGIAVTDSLQIISTALDTVPTHTLLIFLKNYCEHEEVEGFVIGLPKKLDNTMNEIYADIQRFVAQLKAAFPQKYIEEMDERFTSKMAFQSMIDMGLKKKARQNKATIDQISAAILLQNFLHYKKTFNHHA